VRRLPPELVALPLLALAWAVPATGAGLYVRLLAATGVLLLPGALLARAAGRRSMSAALAFSLAGLFAASAVMFALGGSLWLALGIYGGLGLAAMPLARARPAVVPSPVFLAVLAAGAGFGIALWLVAGSLDGDALFHLARVRKLAAFDRLHLASVNEFADGSLHPGYAFPLWHVLLALVARVGGVDPGAVLLHEPSVLSPLALALAYEAGRTVLGGAWAGSAALAAQVAITGLAAGHGGAYPALALPATASRQLLVPALLVLFFAFVRRPSWGGLLALAAGALALALVHPTYALFVAVPLGGYVLVRALLRPRELGRDLAGLGGLLTPAAAVALWLLPLVRQTASHEPGPAERLRGLRHYAGQVDVLADGSFRLAPEVLSRTGAVSVAALVCVPLAALAARRRWSAFVLGGSLAVLALVLLPDLFSRFADAVSLSQARRAAGFLPFALALAGGAAVLARLAGLALLPLALVAGVGLQLAYPGDFGYRIAQGGPAFPAWVALWGGLAALAVAFLRRRSPPLERGGLLAAAAAALFVLPVAVHGFSRWSPAAAQESPLSAGLVRAARGLPAGAVVFSDDRTSYWLAAAAPVYVASALPGHVADTRANRPYARRADARRFFRSGDLRIPRRYRAGYVLVDRARYRLRLPLPRLYGDGRYVLYRLP
jgi:hypothetical protein